MPDTVKSIMEVWLRENHYDGLCGDDCGCGVEDLMPCSRWAGDCEPAMRRPGPVAEYYPAALRAAHEHEEEK